MEVPALNKYLKYNVVVSCMLITHIIKAASQYYALKIIMLAFYATPQSIMLLIIHNLIYFL